MRCPTDGVIPVRNGFERNLFERVFDIHNDFAFPVGEIYVHFHFEATTNLSNVLRESLEKG